MVCRLLRRFSAQLQYIAIQHLLVDPALNSTPRTAKILEIGGGYNPRYSKRLYPNAYHLDHCTTEDLREKFAKDPAVAHLSHKIERVDFVSSASNISAVVPPDLRFDLIYSSHALEHQVDLVVHLQSIERLLAPSGRAILIIPDLRTCFDLYRFPTVTADVVSTHLNRPRVHQARQVFDAAAQSATFNDGHVPSVFELNAITFSHDIRSAYAAAIDSAAPDAHYKDIHAWTFTPVSFRLLLTELNLLELVALKPSWISPRYGNQFCAVLGVAPRTATSDVAGDRDRLARERLSLSRRLHGNRF